MSNEVSPEQLSFPAESYERVSISGSPFGHRYQFGAIRPPLSFSRVCLPNEDGEYRPYKQTAETEFYVQSTGNYYYLGATACPRLLKCSACPLNS